MENYLFFVTGACAWFLIKARFKVRILNVFDIDQLLNLSFKLTYYMDNVTL